MTHPPVVICRNTYLKSFCFALLALALLGFLAIDVITKRSHHTDPYSHYEHSDQVVYSQRVSAAAAASANLQGQVAWGAVQTSGTNCCNSPPQKPGFVSRWSRKSSLCMVCPTPAPPPPPPVDFPVSCPPITSCYPSWSSNCGTCYDYFASHEQRINPVDVDYFDQLYAIRQRIDRESSPQRRSPLSLSWLHRSGSLLRRSTEAKVSTRTSLNGHGIFAIIVFAGVSLIVIHPLRIPIPFLPGPRRSVTIDHVSAPMIGVLLLLATTTIGAAELRAGIIGEDGIEPYDVLALFISLAYIAISLDATGLLRYLAFVISAHARKGMTLFLLLYSFFFAAGVAVGNDPVILSGTAFLVYFTRVAGIVPPDAWIWAQFVAANISSAVLVSSNPTNLVIATGFDVSFITYTAYMVLPSLASALAALGAILVLFRNKKGSKREDTDANTNSQSSLPTHDATPPTIYIPRTLVRPDVNPRAALVDPKGAVFGSAVMAATLATLVGTSVVGGVKVFEIALPGAALCLIRDAAADYIRSRRQRGESIELQERSRNQAENSAAPAPAPGPSSEANPRSEAASAGAEKPEPASPPPTPAPTPPPVPQSFPRLRSALGRFRTTFPTVCSVFSRLPFPLLPFAFGMFILVQALSHVGFINILARGLGRVCAAGHVPTAFFISFLGIVLCNIGGTNIGATILLTKAVRSPYFQAQLGTDETEIALILKTCTYAIAFGSNVGALAGTFAASLAGLLWREALRQGGVHVRPLQFFAWCAAVIVPATVAGISVLIAEVRYFKL